MRGITNGWFVWGMKWKVGLWWCMIKQMGDENYDIQ
jgi:hypothetical protein